MRMYDIIKKKRDGGTLTDAEIRFFTEGYVAGDIPDYQASALCMAIFFRGMTAEETTALTLAIRDSGATLSFPEVKGLRVDKHSTGGVGDKTSLVVAPLVASLGVKVAKMSGRGLGHTGGTVDKLEAIEGFRTELDIDTFQRIVNEVGIAIIGQTATIAPADKLLYALRDVTATVDSIPLIASSIMGKKLAADDDCIVLDVKTGSGAFMKDVAQSEELARMMVDIGKLAGKRTVALVTDMDRPLGLAIGNTLEVIEAIETLNGGGPADFRTLCVKLASHMLCLADHGTLEACEAMVEKALADGSALDTFAKMVKAQGGCDEWIYHPERFPRAPHTRQVLAPADGYITSVDTEGYGTAALLLGAGRSKKEDTIDPTAGILLAAKTGDAVKRGQVLATLHTSNPALLDAAEQKLLASTVITDHCPDPRPLILAEID